MSLGKLKDQFGGAKKLGKDEDGNYNRHFTANGNKYTIRNPDECITITRWGIYEKFTLMYSFNASLQDLTNNIKKGSDMLNDILKGGAGANAIDVIMHYKSVLDGLVRKSKEKYSTALYMCTLFILSENEDITKWNKDQAESKISDWAKEGLSVEDFFCLALLMQADYVSVLTKHLENEKK